MTPEAQKLGMIAKGLGLFDEPEDPAVETAKPKSTEDLLIEAGRSDNAIREFIGLSEGTDTGDEFPICIIKAGRGSSGFYPKEVLQRDGAKAFPAGTKMFMNHAGLAERVNQPERKLQDLAGVTSAAPYWDESGAAGAGLYTKCNVFSDWREQIKEKAAHTGVSIVAAGAKEKGEVDGFRGFIVKEISEGLSIDFVTSPGAGGKALPLAESVAGTELKETTMSTEEIQQKLEESADKLREEFKETLKPIEAERDEFKAQLARRKEADLTAEAKSFAGTEAAALLKDASLSEVQRKGALSRVVEKVAGNPPLKDGALAKAEFRETITAAVKAEVVYIAEVSGAGKPADLGGKPANSTGLPTLEESRKAMAGHFAATGMSEDAAKRAAQGRVQ